MNVLDLSEQEINRRKSLEELRQMGIDPYPAAEYPTNAFSTEIKESFKDDEKRTVCIAGRMMSKRVMVKPVLPKFRIPKDAFRFTSPAMIFVPEKIKTYTPLYSNVYWIWATLSA